MIKKEKKNNKNRSRIDWKTRDRVERSIESKGETAETSEPGQAVIHHHVYRHSCFGSQLVRAYSCSYSVSLATLSCFGHPSCRTYDKASCILNHSASEANASFFSLSLTAQYKYWRTFYHKLSTSINKKKKKRHRMWKLSITLPYSNARTFLSFAFHYFFEASKGPDLTVKRGEEVYVNSFPQSYLSCLSIMYGA